MKYGVVYTLKQHKKINGTLFYCYEYCQMLRQFVDAKFYIVGATADDIQLITTLFSQKYNTPVTNIVPIGTILELYGLKLDKTLILDVHTFYAVKEFATNEVICYSNDTHPMYRYKNDRVVTYFGSYDYQPRDQFAYLKLGFSLFAPCSSTPGVFVSSVGESYLLTHADRWISQYDKPVIIKRHQTGLGNIFDHIDTVHYVHTVRDKNNRVIPEAIFHGKTVVIEYPMALPIDSVQLRYDDIQNNGLGRYTLTDNDEMIQLCLK